MISRIMRSNYQSTIMLFIGAWLLIALLGGCTLIDVFVKVDTNACPPSTGTRVVSGGGPGGLPDEGLCAAGAYYNGQAAGFWHMSLNRAITAGENFHCVGTSSKKCPASPGTCTGGNCKSRYYPVTATTGSCNCGCVY